MAVERTVQINIQTNAPKAASEIAQVDRAVDSMAQTAEAGVGRVERATGRLGQAAGGVQRTLRTLNAPFQALARIGAIIGGVSSIVATGASLFGAESTDQRASRLRAEEIGAGNIGAAQRNGASGAGVRSLLDERRRLMAERSAQGGGITDFFRGTIGFDPSFGEIQQIDDSVAAIDRQLEAIERHSRRQAESSERAAAAAEKLVRFRAR